MSTATIHITDVQAAAVRESLHATRRELAEGTAIELRKDKREAIDALLDQLDDTEGSRLRSISGSHDILWCALYDTLCKAAEDLAVDCNEIWRGTVDIDRVRAQLAVVGGHLTLLETFAAQRQGVSST